MLVSVAILVSCYSFHLTSTTVILSLTYQAHVSPVDVDGQIKWWNLINISTIHCVPTQHKRPVCWAYKDFQHIKLFGAVFVSFTIILQ